LWLWASDSWATENDAFEGVGKQHKRDFSEAKRRHKQMYYQNDNMNSICTVWLCHFNYILNYFREYYLMLLQIMSIFVNYNVYFTPLFNLHHLPIIDLGVSKKKNKWINFLVIIIRKGWIFNCVWYIHYERKCAYIQYKGKNFFQ
jgi:hypothetical protein